jgi:hypothetical protein
VTACSLRSFARPSSSYASRSRCSLVAVVEIVPGCESEIAIAEIEGEAQRRSDRSELLWAQFELYGRSGICLPFLFVLAYCCQMAKVTSAQRNPGSSQEFGHRLIEVLLLLVGFVCRIVRGIALRIVVLAPEPCHLSRTKSHRF